MRRYAIVGPVNVGKSSLFYALTGLYVNPPFNSGQRGLSGPEGRWLPRPGRWPGWVSN